MENFRHTRNINFGFTLSEVLITMGIIGVIVAITLSTLISKQQEKSTVVKLEKTYSILSQALQSAIQEYDEVNNWCSTAPFNTRECSSNIANKFAKQLKIVKKCKANDKGCYPNNGRGWKPLHEGSWHMPEYKPELFDDANLVLSDGSIVIFKGEIQDNDGTYWCASTLKGSLNSQWASYYNSCGKIFVDINGLKGPNVYGKDLFDFKIFRNGIQPTGLKIDTIAVNSFLKQCIQGKGSDCTGWVLQNKNLDYLHCPDKLGWDKASSCK